MAGRSRTTDPTHLPRRREDPFEAAMAQMGISLETSLSGDDLTRIDPRLARVVCAYVSTWEGRSARTRADRRDLRYETDQLLDALVRLTVDVTCRSVADAVTVSSVNVGLMAERLRERTGLLSELLVRSGTGDLLRRSAAVVVLFLVESAAALGVHSLADRLTFLDLVFGPEVTVTCTGTAPDRRPSPPSQVPVLSGRSSS